MSDHENKQNEFDSFLNSMREAEHEHEAAEAAPAAQESEEPAKEPAQEEMRSEESTQQPEQGEKAIYADPVNPKKKHKAAKIIISVLVAVALLAGGGYFALHSFFNQFSFVPLEEQTAANTDTSAPDAVITEPTDANLNPELSISDLEYDTLIELLDANAEGNGVVMQDENVWNVLLIGADEMLSETTGRSDSMILVSVSHYTDTIVLTSILRDSYLKIPENGYNRINAALPYGGVSLLAETIESNFGIHVDNYAMIDFQLFIDIINALGGVYLTPTDDETEYINEIMTILNHEDMLISTPNERTLFNGLQALYYARIRKMDSDTHRTERQRKIILAAKERVLSMDLSEILDIVTEFMPRVVTDIDSKTCISLLFSAFKMLQQYDIQQHCMPMESTYDDTYVYGMSVKRIYDFETNTATWMDLVYGNNEPVLAETSPTELPTDENGNDVLYAQDTE